MRACSSPFGRYLASSLAARLKEALGACRHFDDACQPPNFEYVAVLLLRTFSANSEVCRKPDKGNKTVAEDTQKITASQSLPALSGGSPFRQLEQPSLGTCAHHRLPNDVLQLTD